MNDSLFIFKNAANDSIALFGKDLSAIDASSGAVTLYFNSQDSSGADVNSVALGVTTGEENEVVEFLGQRAKTGGTLHFDDVVTGKNFPHGDITGITSITLNGVPSVGVNSQFRVLDKDSDYTLTSAESGAMVAIRSGNDIKLPTPEVGLLYTFFAAEDITTTNATIVSTSDGSTGVALMFGSITDGGAADPIDNDSTLTLNQGTATDSVIIRAYCVGSGTTANDQTWLIEGQTGATGSVTPS